MQITTTTLSGDPSYNRIKSGNGESREAERTADNTANNGPSLTAIGRTPRKPKY